MVLLVTRPLASSSQPKHQFPPKYSRKGWQHFQKWIPLGLSHFHAVFSMCRLHSFHGSGFMEAPPYRLPGKWLPTAPITLPNGKVKSCGQDTQNSGSAEGPGATAVPVFSWRPFPLQSDGDRDRHHPRRPASWASQGTAAEPGAAELSLEGPVWHN